MIIRRVEVDHQADVVEVDPARCHIGGHQHADLAVGEALKSLLAHRLAQVAMQLLGTQTQLVKALGQSGGSPAGAAEHQREILFVLDDLDEGFRAVGWLHGDKRLREALRQGDVGAGVVLGLDQPRASGHLVGQTGHFAVESGREQHGLAVIGDSLENRLNLGDEPHVEHAVGLVEDEHLQLGEVNQLLAHQVEQAARGGHDEVRTGGLLGLAVKWHATVGHCGFQVQRGGNGLHLGCDLRCQLAGWCQHKGAGVAVGLIQELHRGDGEGDDRWGLPEFPPGRDHRTQTTWVLHS